MIGKRKLDTGLETGANKETGLDKFETVSPWLARKMVKQKGELSTYRRSVLSELPGPLGPVTTGSSGSRIRRNADGETQYEKTEEDVKEYEADVDGAVKDRHRLTGFDKVISLIIIGLFFLGEVLTDTPGKIITASLSSTSGIAQLQNWRNADEEYKRDRQRLLDGKRDVRSAFRQCSVDDDECLRKVSEDIRERFKHLYEQAYPAK